MTRAIGRVCRREDPLAVRQRVAIAVVAGTVAVITLGAAAILSVAARPADAQGRAQWVQQSASASAGATPPAGPSAVASSSTPPGNCARPAGASPAVRVTDVNLGTRVAGYGQEAETDPLPMAIAATPAGGSWLAWLGGDGKVYLGRLDCDDHLVGTPTTSRPAATAASCCSPAGATVTTVRCAAEPPARATRWSWCGSTTPATRSGSGRSPT